MSPSIKLIFAFLQLVACLVIVLFFFMENLAVQLAFVFLLSVLLLLSKGGKRWLAGLRLMLPFLVSLIIVYSLFGLFRLHTPEGEPGSFQFWLEFGSIRILLFVNSVLAFQLFFSIVGFNDLLHLPLKIGTMKYVILGKMLSNTAINSYQEITFHQSLIPSEQYEKLPFSHRFKARLSSVLALMLSLITEASHKGQYIDNRIIHCHQVKKYNPNQWYLILGFLVMVTVATMIIPIPVPGGGFFNFGDVMIVFIGLYAGKKAGAIAGGIGSAIADLLLFPLFAPITLIVKGLEGFICGLAHQKSGFWQIIFPLIGAIVIIVGYFIGEWFLPQLGKAVALADLPVNIVQALVGFVGGRTLFEAAKYLNL